jgi:hypothetical protein
MLIKIIVDGGGGRKQMDNNIRVRSRFKSLITAAVICIFQAAVFAHHTNAQEKQETTAAGSKAKHLQQSPGSTQTKNEDREVSRG